MLEDIQGLHNLLDSYKSILLRFNQDDEIGRKFNNWNYNFQSNQGRPDRARSKYTSDEAFNQLHHVDVIFPQYENFFNVSEEENSSTIRGILGERIHNIEEKLRRLQDGLENGTDNFNRKTVEIFTTGVLSILVMFFF